MLLAGLLCFLYFVLYFVLNMTKNCGTLHYVNYTLNTNLHLLTCIYSGVFGCNGGF